MSGFDTHPFDTEPFDPILPQDRWITKNVIIGGETILVHDIRTGHDVDSPIGTGSVTISAPIPYAVQPGAPVVVQAGWNGATSTIFTGRVAKTDATFDDSGAIAKIPLEGESWRLSPRFYRNRGYVGPLDMAKFVRSLCSSRGVPSFLTDSARTPSDGPLMLGSNSDVDNNWVPLNTNTSPMSLITRLSELFGYRYFDTPMGTARWMRISGYPDDYFEDMPLYAEGVNMLSMGRGESFAEMANYIEVKGAKYQAADTSEVAIRSIPATVPFDARFGPDGVNQMTINDELLVTETLAAAARNAHEIDYGGPLVRWRWQTTGDPERQPGEAVAVMSDKVNAPSDGTFMGDLIHLLPQPMWLMRVEHTISDSGWTTTMEGWTGNGSKLPAGNDCVTQTLLGNGGVHIGNEYLWHYRNPNPSSTQYDIPFTLPDNYSTATVRYYGHGTNSFNFNIESEASRFEVWHSTDTDRASGSGIMPRLEENLEQRLDYAGDDALWDHGVVPLTGSYKAGSNVLRIISGEDRDVGDIDDYEIRDVRLTLCGVGVPDIIVE